VQCLGVAWDTERKRWFHLYPNEPIPSTDVLHWTRPLQNWNYMCAECHSTDLRKNYDLATNRYHTTYSEINVSCETCHGPASLHVKLAQSHKIFWDRRYGYGLPRLKGPDPRPQLESCAPCHARRRIVYPGYQGGDRLLDYYLPELLDGELYYADGQIRDEDYEYGSFIQSKMYHKQVRCTDCHDPHTMHVKFKAGPVIRDNRLCAQCHLPSRFDTPAHHHHPDATKPGTLCIECHMPKTTYMVVDPRLDHSIRIPRPDLTVAVGIPNACSGCHHDQAKGQTPQWAEAQVRTWYGERRGPPHFAYALAAGRQLKPEGFTLLQSLLRRKDISAMVRASAVLLLSRYGPDAVEAAGVDALDDPSALVRAAAVRSLQELSAEKLARWLAPKLVDPMRAVRSEAARVLSAVPPRELSAEQQQALDAALREYVTAQHAVDEQPGAHLNLAVLAANRGQTAESLAEYHVALRLDPAFVPARNNLAMHLDQQGDKAGAEREFRKIIQQEPKSPEAYYSLGLLLAEDPQRIAEAAGLLGRAAELAPQNSRIRYNWGLALQTLGRPAEAEKAFKAAFELQPGSTDYLHALAILYTQQGRWPQAVACAEQLVRMRPNEPQFQQFLAEVRRLQQAARNK
jgi:tetratricopeptide (TPR) repeat protein